MKSSFISIYQEKVAPEKNSTNFNRIVCGTQTNTDTSRESSDQAPRTLGTQTQTRIRETPDSHIYGQQFVIIPT
ncbi:hypothetical protein H1P_50002 [Hyella patelloides LEGE 07179]|uniref:Uncharacterized protein n=1 Tax=Hyella patelloides LEGE 07179 TaxID=945734 RepID=A0A563VZJ9_9CYAN|nr:hypothetical protein [Hyella patelloides]VEP16797.1 hypothetical protein H1P_50002 [Hyella patelloides LEGE 07179]